MRVLLPAFLLSLLLVGGPASANDDWKQAKKQFKSAQRSEDWNTRRGSYTDMSYFDTADAVKMILSAFAKEKNPAVILGGIEVLAGYKSLEATEAISKALAKSRGERKLYLLMVIERQKGKGGLETLTAVLRGKDKMAAAQAALALGRKKALEVIPDLKGLLLSKDWQLRAAAARALQEMQGREAIGELAKSLEMSKGSERGAIVRCLEEITGEKFGLDVSAWKKLASGVDGDDIRAKPVKVPHVFGIPIYGRRIVIVLTNSQHNENPHRFGTGKRLEELCQVPGGRPIVHTRLVTVGMFIRAHVKRLLSDMPSGTYGELLIFNTTVTPLWSKLTPLNGTTKTVAKDAIDGATPYAGMNHYDALLQALDISGSKDTAAWKKGPDEIIFTACNVANQGEIKEPDVVAAAIAFKARMRMVPIHTIGVGAHGYDMLRAIAAETGAVYLNLYE